MVVNSLVEGIACFPLMAGFEGIPPRGGDVGAAEGWGGEAEEFERSKNVKCERDQIPVIM